MAAKPLFATGARVEHAKFGVGSVSVCTEDRIAIKFDEHGEKKFVLDMARESLKKSDTAAPDAKKRAPRKKAAPAAAAK
ncbi:MAG: hypothetical protein NTZ56_24400 [Acidobacteria bacterium]|nr:hypothetical protein [Acidobacteriota bacterium]